MSICSWRDGARGVRHTRRRLGRVRSARLRPGRRRRPEHLRDPVPPQVGTYRLTKIMKVLIQIQQIYLPPQDRALPLQGLRLRGRHPCLTTAEDPVNDWMLHSEHHHLSFGELPM